MDSLLLGHRKMAPPASAPAISHPALAPLFAGFPAHCRAIGLSSRELELSLRRFGCSLPSSQPAHCSWLILYSYSCLNMDKRSDFLQSNRHIGSLLNFSEALDSCQSQRWRDICLKVLTWNHCTHLMDISRWCLCNRCKLVVDPTLEMEWLWNWHTFLEHCWSFRWRDRKSHAWTFGVHHSFAVEWTRGKNYLALFVCLIDSFLLATLSTKCRWITPISLPCSRRISE